MFDGAVGLMSTTVTKSGTNHGLSDQVRLLAWKKYLQPAIREGRSRVSVAARDLMNELRSNGFPDKNWHQICSAIQAEKFLRENGLEIEKVDGPPSKTSSTVVVHYRITTPKETEFVRASEGEGTTMPVVETPEEWAHRMTGKLFGLMKDEFAAFGGGEAFLRWVRSDDEDEAA